MSKVSFIGLGVMGYPMAGHLARNGFSVRVYNRTRTKAEQWLAEYGDAGLHVIADTPREAAIGADVTMLCVGNDDDVRSVVLGADGALAGLAAGTLLIDHTTASRTLAETLNAACAQANVGFLDAPVSGATQAAQAGKLMIMVGGSEEIAQTLLPIFDALGEKTIILGKQSAGATMKLAINSVIHSLNQAAAESLNLAQAAGIELPLAYEALESSAACAPMLRYRKPLYLDERAHQVTFTVGLAAKDVDLATRLAQSLDVQMPQAELNLGILNQASQNGYANRDMASVISYLKKEQT